MTVDFSGVTPPTAPQGDQPNGSNGAAPAPANQNNQDEGVVLEWNGRKFTKDDLVRKLESADGFIETLKQERQEDRQLLNEVQETLKKQLTAQELLAQVKAQAANPEPKQDGQPVVDANAIAAQVLAKLQGDQAKAKEDENWQGVVAKLSESYGDKVNEKVKAVADANDLTLQEAAQLARTKPALFLKLFPEVSKAPTKPVLHSNGGNRPVTPAAPAGDQAKAFGAARTTRESVSLYLSRLKELTG